MTQLLYLYVVATDPHARPKSGLARSPFIAWLYGQAFLSILGGNRTRLVMCDCDAWTETPDEPVQPPIAFAGDMEELATRAILSDDTLGRVLHRRQRSRGRTECVTSNREVGEDRLAAIRAALAGIPPERLLDPENVPRVHAALAA